MTMFPTDADLEPPTSLRTTHKLPIIVHPTYPLRAGELDLLASHLKVGARVLSNNYDHHIGSGKPALFKCEPYSRLKMAAGDNAIGITVLPPTMLRYGTMRTEHLRMMEEAAKGVGRGFVAKHAWSDSVKEAYELMSTTANAVNELFPPASMRLRKARMTYLPFTTPPTLFAIYELQAS